MPRVQGKSLQSAIYDAINEGDISFPGQPGCLRAQSLAVDILRHVRTAADLPPRYRNPDDYGDYLIRWLKKTAKGDCTRY